jgi:hypothetical protein
MVRLGLHLVLRSGREALVRLLVTAAAVGVGVALLLSVLALYHGYQATIDRPCWECTYEQAVPDGSASMLWNYRQDVYRGRTIERLDVATSAQNGPTAPDVPTVPGIPRMPAVGQFYASPALAVLLRTVPGDELGDRFPGALAGTIGRAGLSSPDELAIVVGRPTVDLQGLPGTIRVASIATVPDQPGTSKLYQYGFAIAAVTLLVPILVLIGTASRLAAARREERYAAIRLAGATTNQINVIASVDAIVGALLGALLGIAVFAALRSPLSQLRITGSRFFATDITPPGWGYPLVLVGVPLAVVATCLVSLRRVGASPLGVSRRLTPPAPSAWRIVPLAAGLLLFCVPPPGRPTNGDPNLRLAVPGLLLVILGMPVAGPWLAMQAARLLGRLLASASCLLAARRLADDPRAAFRSVSGLVLAVLVGTALAGVAPAAVAAEQIGPDGAFRNVLRAHFTTAWAGPCGGECPPAGTAGPPSIRPTPSGPSPSRRPLWLPPTTPNPPPPPGLPAASATALFTALQRVPGTTVLRMYYPGPGRTAGDAVMSCDDLRHFPILGRCAPGVAAVEADTPLFTDNVRAMDANLPFVTANSRAVTGNLADLNLTGVLVSVDSPVMLERVRTLLTSYTALSGADTAPQTLGEVGQARDQLYLEIRSVVTFIAGLTLLIAGCSVAIAVSGSLVERKRPFTLLRLCGTSTRTLYGVVLLETALPLAAATLIAAMTGYAIALPIARTLAPGRHVIPALTPTYYLILGSGLLLAAAVNIASLPILGRITRPDNVRFE